MVPAHRNRLYAVAKGARDVQHFSVEDPAAKLLALKDRLRCIVLESLHGTLCVIYVREHAQGLAHEGEQAANEPPLRRLARTHVAAVWLNAGADGDRKAAL